MATKKTADGVGRRDYFMVPVNLIVINDDNNYRSAKDVKPLADSIAAEGIQNPIKCYKNANGEYVLQSGFRRMAAVKLINSNGKEKIERVPVILEERYANEADRDVHQLLENAHREDATPIEKAKAYQRLITVHGIEVDEVARRLGETPETIKRYLAVLQAAQPIRKAMEKGEIGLTAASQIAKKHADDGEAQKKALELAIKASGGKKKATVKATQKATRVRTQRQTVRSVENVKDAIMNVEKFTKENTLSDELKIRYKAYSDSLYWMLDNEKVAPWE